MESTETKQLKELLAALGLRKLNASVEVEATPQILGMVRRVSSPYKS